MSNVGLKLSPTSVGTFPLEVDKDLNKKAKKPRKGKETMNRTINLNSLCYSGNTADRISDLIGNRAGVFIENSDGEYNITRLTPSMKAALQAELTLFKAELMASGLFKAIEISSF